MFDLGSEKEEIAALKQRIAFERSELGERSRALLPGSRARIAAGAGRKALHLMKPLAIVLLRRALTGLLLKKSVLKAAGVAALAFGAWKMFGDDDTGALPED